MKEVNTAPISNYIDRDGNVEVFLQSDGKYIKFTIDTGINPPDIQTTSSKPNEGIEMSLKTVKYCDSSGTEYEMYIIASDAWETGGG